MKSILGKYGTIHFGDHAYVQLNNHIEASSYSLIFVLVDSNTHTHCLPHFLSHLETDQTIEIIEIEPGEDHKTIETCLGVWHAMSELGGDRRSLMINLGGGVVTDLGGFVASAFKRGIDFINVPTSLLAMVDASIGGKTGVDLGVLKNQIGVINMGDMVLIDSRYLTTLPERQMRSGMAEMFKHGLIASREYWNRMADFKGGIDEELDTLIYDSICIKYDIVKQDPTEKSIRKALNFGHTIGHAIESYFLEHSEKDSLLHGEAIAIGMIMEGFLSKAVCNFGSEDLDHIKMILLKNFDRVQIDQADESPIIELLKHDKKNTYGRVNFVLLNEIGSFKLDCQADESLISQAFDYYRS
ncbi:MAG: 3-dehydroquinate synthase [Flavobacteriaceae bacterium]|nr:3-dehydroquinate synthase [Bacteroidia bacterium]MBT8287517.1 3-dehydroquinate synthase [Bacteroidia bacterium]NNF75322.1 3-dehydroquinate synthase [Flavobacteriaceae bacterium]NNK74387.1 3-dehydroquinate synthase [Flavobacteriaceae bacterium]